MYIEQQNELGAQTKVFLKLLCFRVYGYEVDVQEAKDLSCLRDGNRKDEGMQQESIQQLD